MKTHSRWRTVLFGAVTLVAMFPIVAAAKDLGPYQITSGTLIETNTSVVSGNGFTAEMTAEPRLLSADDRSNFHGGTPKLNFCFGCGLPGSDDGVGILAVTEISDPALAGLVQVFRGEGYVETGGLTVSQTIDVTGPGTYSSPFTLFATVAYGPTSSATPTQHVDFAGSGTVTLVVEANSNPLGPLQIKSLNYTFATLLSMGPQAMEGDLTLNPGTILEAGYDFTMPGNHPAATVSFVGAKVTFAWKCVSRPGSGTLVVPIPDQSYEDTQNSPSWYPSGEQNTLLVYQGSVAVPNVCNGGPVSFQAGGTFTTGVSSTDTTDKVHVRWHYSGNGSAGGWSATASVVPK